MSVTLLHTADWQIGRQYGGFEPEDAVPLADARLAAVERLAALAREQQVDAVLVAGDVWDAQTVSPRTLRRLGQALEGFAGPWVMIPGNHDAALAEGVWAQAQRLGALPPQVHAVLSPQVLELPALRLAVLCAPLTQRHTHEDLTAWFDTAATPEGWCRVGLAHGAVQGVLAEDLDSANPIAPDRAARARLDYLALGDWHGCKSLDARTWYSGTPEPDRFKANDSGRALHVRLEGPGALPQVQALDTAQYRWRQWETRLDVPTDLDELLERLAALAAADVVSLQVHGTLDLAGHQRLREALAAAEARARALRADLDALRLAPTAQDLARLQADGYLGELVARLQNPPPEEATVAQDALALLADLLHARGSTTNAA